MAGYVFTWNTTSESTLFNTWTGVSFQQSLVQPGHILDGAAFTILIGEKSLNPEFYLSYSGNGSITTTTELNDYDYADNENMYVGADNDIDRVTGVAPVQDTPGVNSYSGLGSAQPNGVFMAMCDGSVRLIKYGVDQTTFQSLGSRNDCATGLRPPIDESKLK